MSRARDEGSFSRLPDGRWSYRVSLGVDQEGRRERRRFYGSTRDECRRQAEDYRAAIRAGRTPPTGETLSDYLPHWLEGRRPALRERTARGYEQHIRVHLIPLLGHVTVTGLTRRNVVDMMARLRSRGLSARTANAVKVTLGSAMQDTLRDGMVPQNVVRLVKQLPYQPPEFQPLHAHEIEALRDVVRGTRDEALYTLALAYGLRQGELLGLTWADVNFETGVLHVTHALAHRGFDDFSLVDVKTRQSRRAMVMPPFVASVLERHHELQRHDRKSAGSWWPSHFPDLVFREPNGRPLHGPTVTRRFQRTLDELGIPRRRFHDLRHTCATYLLLSGVEMKVIQQILGHAAISVTADVYAHVLPRMQEDALSLMGTLLAREVEPGEGIEPPTFALRRRRSTS